MSSLFFHQTAVQKASINRQYLIKNKNKQGSRKFYLNVKNFKSPSPRSLSKRKNSAMKLFKQAHRVGSQTTQQTYLSPEAKSNLKIDSTQSISSKKEQNPEKINSLKTKRANTMEQKRTKITLKKAHSQGNNIQHTVQVSINGEVLKEANHTDLMSDLTRMILNQNQNLQDTSAAQIDWSNIFQQNSINETSFQLQIDSNLMQNSKNALEWQELIKRI